MELNLHREGPPPDEAAGTLVLLHGIGSRWQAWLPVLPALAERFDVIALDLPGFAGSAMPPAPAAERPGVATLCDLVTESLSELGVAPGFYHVAGNSLGGALALELAHRGDVRSACALAPAGFGTRPEMWLAHASLGASVRIARRLAPHADAIAARPRARALAGVAFFAHPTRIPPAVLADDLRALAGAPWFDATLRTALPELAAPPDDADVPVTIAWGTRDRVLSPRGAERAWTQMRRARVVLLPGLGHLPMWDDPGAVARVMLEATGVDAEAGTGTGRGAPGQAV